MNDGQDDLEDSKKKKKERKKRIKQKNLGYKSEDRFDEENETVIRMTNKNRLKKEEETRKKLTKPCLSKQFALFELQQHYFLPSHSGTLHEVLQASSQHSSHAIGNCCRRKKSILNNSSCP